MPEAQIVETLIEEAMRIAEEMGDDADAERPRRQRELIGATSRRPRSGRAVAGRRRG